MRLFFALWPTTNEQWAWHTATGDTVRQLGGRRLSPDKLHLTLAFLGDTPADRVAALERLGDRLPAEAFQLRFDRIETWGGGVVACLRAETPPALATLVEALNRGLQGLSLPVERRRFKAHITVARKVRPGQPAVPLWPAIDWRPARMALVRSELTANGAEYVPIATWDFPATTP